METPLEIYRILADGPGAVALATIVSIKGSSPGKPGFKMLVYPNGKTVGTVGGGNLEQAVIKDSLAAIEAGQQPVLKEYSLTKQGLGMWCGGEALVLIEPLAATAKLWIFGYGNLGREVCRLLSGLHFATVVLHDDNVAGMDSVVFDWESLSPFPEVGTDDYILALVMDAEIELAIVEQVASANPKYIGIVGSKTKGAKIKKKLVEAGIEVDQLNLHIPVGLPIGAQTTTEVAISIVAELVKENHGG